MTLARFAHAANMSGEDDPLLRPHPAYVALGPCDDERHRAYRALFDEVLSLEETDEIRAYIQQQRALGSDRFRAAIERELGRCVLSQAGASPTRRSEATS